MWDFFLDCTFRVLTAWTDKFQSYAWLLKLNLCAPSPQDETEEGQNNINKHKPTIPRERRRIKELYNLFITLSQLYTSNQN